MHVSFSVLAILGVDIIPRGPEGRFGGGEGRFRGGGGGSPGSGEGGWGDPGLGGSGGRFRGVVRGGLNISWRFNIF